MKNKLKINNIYNKKGGNSNFDTTFLSCYESNLHKVQEAIKKYSGKHYIDQMIAEKFVNGQLNEIRKRAARDLVENTVYITLEELSTIIEKLIIELYTKTSIGNAEHIYMYSGKPEKSFYFVSILALFFIRKHGYKEPSHFIHTLDMNLFDQIGNSPLILLDDASYSGSQMSEMLYNIYYDVVIKNKKSPPNIHILICALNDFSKIKLEIVPIKKHTMTNKQSLFLEFTKSPFQLFFLPERLYTPLIVKLGIERYFYLTIFFSLYTTKTPFLSLYFDHKLADEASTYKIPLMYGPIVPSNYNDFLHKLFDYIESYDFIPEEVKKMEFYEKLILDFNQTFHTTYSTKNTKETEYKILDKLISHLKEKDVCESIIVHNSFFPFLNTCNNHELLINNTNDPDIINYDYHLFMLPYDCIEDGPECVGDNELIAILKENKELFQITPKNIAISNKIHNCKCPDTWYKHGPLQMKC